MSKWSSPSSWEMRGRKLAWTLWKDASAECGEATECRTHTKGPHQRPPQPTRTVSESCLVPMHWATRILIWIIQISFLEQQAEVQGMYNPERHKDIKYQVGWPNKVVFGIEDLSLIPLYGRCNCSFLKVLGGNSVFEHRGKDCPSSAFFLFLLLWNSRHNWLHSGLIPGFALRDYSLYSRLWGQ